MDYTKQTADILGRLHVRGLRRHLKYRKLPLIHEEAIIEAVLNDI